MEVVEFSSLATDNGKTIGVATLNSERSLNALSLDMVALLEPKLQQWRDDPQVVCVWLQGAGEKAFCAGGDIVAMYKAMQQRPGKVVSEVEDFFTREYRLDYLIQTFPKPFVVWGSGFVMGGGMGLMNGASHRIVTETSRLAMPEVSIGLYPDVGGTYFLNRLTDGLGLFLGLTGAQMNASDALHVQLADYFVPSSNKPDVLAQLQSLEWGDTPALNRQKLSDALQSIEQAGRSDLPRSGLKARHTELVAALQGQDVEAVVANILALDAGDDVWLQRAQKNLRQGCPMTAHIVWAQLQCGTELSLAECFQMELTLSVNCAVKGDFAEGIRALLIDKDQQPKWHYPSVAEVPAEAVDEMFVSPWSADAHPLADLAKG